MNDHTPPKQTDQQRAGAALFAAIKHIRDTWPAQLEMITLQAMSCKARYDAAIEAGFDKDQALQICIKRWEL